LDVSKPVSKPSFRTKQATASSLRECWSAGLDATPVCNSKMGQRSCVVVRGARRGLARSDWVVAHLLNYDCLRSLGLSEHHCLLIGQDTPAAFPVCVVFGAAAGRRSWEDQSDVGSPVSQPAGKRCVVIVLKKRYTPACSA